MTTENHGRLWDVKDVAAYLHTTPHAVYKLVERRAIPHVRLGRKILFDPDTIRAWISDHQVAPADGDCGRRIAAV
jgi:excisionase family DNA binding protein